MKTTDNHNEPKLNVEGVSEQELKRNAFKTPEGYFENLTPRVMEAIRASEEKPAEPSFNWQRLLFPAIGIATIGMTAILIFNPNETETLDFDAALATVTLEELDAFVEFETEELLAYELVSYDGFESNVDEQDVFNYLIEEDVELEELEELEI